MTGDAKARIGFVGLGAMGLPMARNLLAAGHELAGFDLKPAAMDALGEAGGRRAQSVMVRPGNTVG